MKLTKSYLRKVIKEELKDLSEAVDPAELVQVMISKLGPLKGKIDSATKTIDLKLDLVKALLSSEIFQMDPAVLDQMVNMLKRSIQKGKEAAKAGPAAEQQPVE